MAKPTPKPQPILILGLLVLAGGCSTPRAPKIRMGNYPTATLAISFRDLEDLGPHGYGPRWGESNGIVYTCRAGHIDITHLRAAADWTRYVAELAFERMQSGEHMGKIILVM